jgi:hypothetical protein
MGEAFKTACTLIKLRPTGPLVTNRGSNLLLPLPRPRLGIGVLQVSEGAPEATQEVRI